MAPIRAGIPVDASRAASARTPMVKVSGDLPAGPSFARLSQEPSNTDAGSMFIGGVPTKRAANMFAGRS